LPAIATTGRAGESGPALRSRLQARNGKLCAYSPGDIASSAIIAGS
jgi:hypothetical protein